jgi:hypothetical protein
MHIMLYSIYFKITDDTDMIKTLIAGIFKTVTRTLVIRMVTLFFLVNHEAFKFTRSRDESSFKHKSQSTFFIK